MTSSPKETPQKPFLIGISGGTASGKSSLCQKIVELLGESKEGNKQVIVLNQDCFYRQLSSEELILAKKGEFNLDHPNAFDFDLLFEVLDHIKRGEEQKLSAYDHTLYSRTEISTVIPAGVDVVIVEGILTFYTEKVRQLFHLKLFVDSDADTRLSRRVLRDTEEKGRDINFILNNYSNFVKPAFEEFCLPTKKYADVILPRGMENKVGIDVIVQHIKDVMEGPSRCRLPPAQQGLCVGSPTDGTLQERALRLHRTKSESHAGVSRPH